MTPFPLKTKTTTRVLRQFAAAWLVFFLMAAANAIWRHNNRPAGFVFAIIALIGIPGLIKPFLIRPLFIVASLVTFPIGWLVSQVALLILFYGVVTPLGYFWRLRRRDLLQLRAKADQSSFWTSRESEPPTERYLKQF